MDLNKKQTIWHSDRLTLCKVCMAIFQHTLTVFSPQTCNCVRGTVRLNAGLNPGFIHTCVYCQNTCDFIFLIQNQYEIVFKRVSTSKNDKLCWSASHGSFDVKNVLSGRWNRQGGPKKSMARLGATSASWQRMGNVDLKGRGKLYDDLQLRQSVLPHVRCRAHWCRGDSTWFATSDTNLSQWATMAKVLAYQFAVGKHRL